MRAVIAMQDSVGAVGRRHERAGRPGLIQRAGEILSILPASGRRGSRLREAQVHV